MAENEQSNVTVTVGDTETINNQKYTVTGYVTKNDGEIRTIYTSNLKDYYKDSNGEMQPATVQTGFGTQKYIVDGEEAVYTSGKPTYGGDYNPKTQFVPGKTDQKNIAESMKINEAEIKNSIEIVEELIRKCKTGKDKVDEYANQMKSAVSNIRGSSGNISSVKIDELIELLEKFKKSLEDVLTESEKYDPDSDIPTDKDTKAKNWYEHYYGGANPPINNVDKNYTDEQLAQNPDDRDVARRAINLSSPFNSTGGVDNKQPEPTEPANDTPDYSDQEFSAELTSEPVTPGGGSYSYEPETTPISTTPVTEAPTVPATERPTEVITQPITSAPVTEPAPSNENYSNNYYSNNDNYYGYSNDNEVVQTEAPTIAPVEEEDIIVEGNKYKLPTSSPMSTTTTTTTSKGNSAIPVLAGLAAAAAAGIGAKAYIDRKNNRDNDEEVEDFKTEDWSNNDEISMEYQEPQENNLETLDDEPIESYTTEAPEKYGARTHQELEDLQ